MARRYTKEELKAMLHRSTYHVAFTEGIERITVRKVSAGCGLSDPYIYQCYTDMAELLETAFMEIDREVSTMMSQLIRESQPRIQSLPELEKNCRFLWEAYWSFLMEDPERTVFYWRYYQSAYYSQKLLERRRENYKTFVAMLHEIEGTFGIADKLEADVLTSNIIDGTVSVAVKIHLGYMNRDKVTDQYVYQTVFALPYHLLGIRMWQEESPEKQPEKQGVDS